MIFAVTMNTMRSTSVMSTSAVTWMSATTSSFELALEAMGVPSGLVLRDRSDARAPRRRDLDRHARLARLEIGEDLLRQDLRAREPPLRRTREEVERGDRRDRDADAHRRRDER